MLTLPLFANVALRPRAPCSVHAHDTPSSMQNVWDSVEPHMQVFENILAICLLYQVVYVPFSKLRTSMHALKRRAKKSA